MLHDLDHCFPEITSTPQTFRTNEGRENQQKLIDSTMIGILRKCQSTFNDGMFEIEMNVSDGVELTDIMFTI
jgi:hypothetical protein